MHLDETSCLRQSSSSTSYRSIFTDSSKEGLMHSQIVNCSEIFTWKFGLTIVTSIWTNSLIQWNDRISHPCNLIGPLNCFQDRKDCDQFRIANGTSPLLRLHKGHSSNKKDSCSKSEFNSCICSTQNTSRSEIGWNAPTCHAFDLQTLLVYDGSFRTFVKQILVSSKYCEST